MLFSLRPIFAIASTLLLATLAAIPAHAAVTLTHVHGLSYSADGKQLVIPSHNGLAVFADGRWTTDVWAPLEGFMANVAVRLRWPRAN